MEDNGKTKNELGYMPWIYQNNAGNTARYVLGEKGENPLICIGVNPSTATPNKLDNTLRIVKAWSKRLGFDGWIMLNLYPQRATNPKNLHDICDMWLHRENKKHIYNTLGSGFIFQRTIWAAWGTLIEKRLWLKSCLRTIVGESIIHHRWITVGNRSIKGHPHHPLYLPKKSIAEDFDIATYLEQQS